MARRGPLTRAPGALKGGALLKLSTFLSQLKGDPLAKKQIFEKKSHNAKKLKGGTLWCFSTSILSQNIKKIFSLWGKNFPEKKSRSAEKNWKAKKVPLVSPGVVCYAEKQEKHFWFSSLGQIVQFGAIIFCRTFKN